MLKNQKSIRGGIEDFLNPITDIFITQAPNGSYTHQGTMAVDIRGANAGTKYPYYAPCTCKCIKTYPSSGQAMWQSVDNVRCSNGYIGKVTFMTCHDDSMFAVAGTTIVAQGELLGHMGKKGQATGVHCHIEFSQSADTTWKQNSYGNYCFNNEVDPEDVWFMDNTNVLSGNGKWKYLKDVPVDEPKIEEPKPVEPAVNEDKVKIEELEKEIEELKKQLEEQPKELFTCTKTGNYQIKLYENEKLYVA